MNYENYTSIRQRHQWQNKSGSATPNRMGKVLNKLKKYEQALKLKSDLKEAFEQVASLKKTKGHKLTLNDFCNEL
ncbi:MAG: hypothetical protein M9904_15480 [Chitinophagaceae bacterium]|nr:hypothetical protein [Chitinophagaceae bacterium]